MNSKKVKFYYNNCLRCDKKMKRLVFDGLFVDILFCSKKGIVYRHTFQQPICQKCLKEFQEWYISRNLKG